MSQHDYDISNGGGAAVRADINAALLAILTQNSGATAPAVTKPFMLWYDTANSKLKQRNAADTAWGIVPFAFDASGNLTIGSGTDGSLYLNSSTAYSGRIWQSGSDILLGTGVGQPERMRITEAGVVQLTSGQLKFPATQNASSDANTLDDYEEGTWTPSDASGAGLTFAVKSGLYVKIGRHVILSAKIVYPSTASGSPASIGGLPFTIAATADGNFPSSAINANGNTNASKTLGLQGSNIANINSYLDAQPTNAQLSGANMNWCLTYIAAS